MIQLLFTVVIVEGAVALFLMVNIPPLRKLTIKSLDRVKSGKGPATVKTLAGTVSVIMASSITSILKIQNRAIKMATMTPTDQILMRTHLLEASLMGFSLFLAFVIDRLHHYIRELSGLRINMDSLRKQVKSSQQEYFRLKEEKEGSNEMKVLKDEIVDLRQKLQQLTLDSEAKDREAKAAEANAIALRKQSEGFLLEYDRLLEDNQNLRSQLSTFDRRLSRSDSKKNT
uniref:Endoplasmic reticulum transmembrane protein n=1 Tax=Wollemia nobilis TaxID=56998 RepID=A0A0C9S307_9CONI